jgi:hypothetical protein
MGKHTSRRVREVPRVDPSQTLAWRGIGCALMLVIPALSIAAALATINSSLVGYIPYQLMGYPILPDILYKTEGLRTIFSPIANVQNLYAIIMISAIYMVVLGGVISVVYAGIYRMVNPKTYSPFDAPPPNIKAKKYKR